MLMWLPQTLNSWLLFGIGVLFFFGSFFHLILYHDRLLSVGLAASGVGFAMLGLTEGFADPTPRGRRMYKIGLIAFIIGVPILIKAAYEMASSEW
jgi:hypothetical protein